METYHTRAPEGVISGSFKFKPEIDSAINEFRDMNVIIRAPEIGWLYAPKHGLIIATGTERFQPLPSEQHLTASEVEAEFLTQLEQADFVYVIKPEGYLGIMSVFELGYSRGIKKPIYTSNPIDFHALGIHDPKMIGLMRASMPVMSPTEAARDMHIRLSLADSHAAPTELTATYHEFTKYFGVYDSLKNNPRSNVAEGAIMRLGKRVMLVADGRWENEKLTIPGTRVRHGEKRIEALQRLIKTKMGAEISDVSHFATNFMIPESGYKRSVNPDMFVFDDHIADLGHERVHPKNGVEAHWVTNSELETLILTGQIEPNAAALLASYLETAA